MAKYVYCVYICGLICRRFLDILCTWFVMCLSDIHVRYLREWFSVWQDFWNMGGWKLCDIMMHCFWRLCDIIMYHIWNILDCLGAGFISGVGKKKVICGEAGSDYTWCGKRGGWYFVWCRRVCALFRFSLWKKTILRFSVQYMSLILSICLKPFRLEQQVFICSMSKLSVTERIAESCSALRLCLSFHDFPCPWF